MLRLLGLPETDWHKQFHTASQRPRLCPVLRTAIQPVLYQVRSGKKSAFLLMLKSVEFFFLGGGGTTSEILECRKFDLIFSRFQDFFANNSRTEQNSIDRRSALKTAGTFETFNQFRDDALTSYAVCKILSWYFPIERKIQAKLHWIFDINFRFSTTAKHNDCRYYRKGGHN